jgi:hypothetical protein
MAFLGMRGNGNWVADQRPKSWRETILYLYPNGAAPLTGILSKMGNEAVNDPEFNWWTKSLPTQRGAVTGVYTDSALSTAYTSGAIAGATLYVKMSAADVSQFRPGHQVLLRDASDLTVDVNVKVTDKVVNGASSYIACYLLEADDNSSLGDLSDCDVALVIGNVNPEGGAMPDSIAYDPVKWYNYTQIFRTPLSMTRTAMQTRLRTGDQYKEAKREALELHSIEMEKAFLFGIATERTGDNGKPERTTLGIVPAIKGGYTGMGGSGGTVSNYTLATGYAGQTWVQKGEEWLDAQLEAIFRYGSGDKLAFCGSSVLMAINSLIKNNADYALTSATESYGIKVTKWQTVFGTINLINHPLFSYEATMRNSCVILEPKDIKTRTIQDTMFKPDKSYKEGSWTTRDGIDEEYLTEVGLEYHNPIGWGYLNGFGTTNTLT